MPVGQRVPIWHSNALPTSLLIGQSKTFP